MDIPRPSRPHWPDALQHPKDATSGLKDWNWALERLQQSHNYWISTSHPEGRPHLMIIWGVWWRDAFWFCTGRRTRKAKNLAGNSRCVIATEKADEAVILEGLAKETQDRTIWMDIVQVYNSKYGGDVGPLLEKSNSAIFRVQPQVVFAQDEHADTFVESVTRWTFR